MIITFLNIIIVENTGFSFTRSIKRKIEFLIFDWIRYGEQKYIDVATSV